MFYLVQPYSPPNLFGNQLFSIIPYRNNLGPILFIYLIQAVATMLDKEMRRANITQADYRCYKRTKDGMFQDNPSLSKATNV